MQNFLELIYYFIAFAPGVTVNIILILMQKKYKNVLFNYFAVAYFCTSLLILCYLINNILGLAGIDYLYDFVAIGEAVCMSGILWSASTLINKAFYNNRKTIDNILAAFISLMPVALYAILFFNICDIKIFDNAYYLFFIMALIVDCVLFLAKYQKINHDSFRKLGLIIACMLSFFILIFVLHTFVPKFTFDSFPLFYLIISSLLIMFGWNHFITGRMDEAMNEKEDFLEKCSITKREREIIGLIQQGFSNSDIAKRLIISEKTAANHIYNIYKKLSITSRFELICMFKKN